MTEVMLISFARKIVLKNKGKIMATALSEMFKTRHVIAALISCTFAYQAMAAHALPDRLRTGETLTSGETLISPNGQVKLEMKSGGNLVLYRVSDNVTLWQTSTAQAGSYAKMETNGNFVVKNPSSQVLFQSNTSNSTAYVMLQSDRNLVVYTAARSPLWHTATGIPTPAYSTPAYMPAYWNDATTYSGAIQYYNNCYNYANNRRTGTFAQPGTASGYTGYPKTVQGWRNAAIADGLEPTDSSSTSPAGKTKVALAVGTDPLTGRPDYHWYRKDINGLWTHKPGGTASTNLDNSSVPITNPETANRGFYTEFGGYFFTSSSDSQGHGHQVIY